MEKVRNRGLRGLEGEVIDLHWRELKVWRKAYESVLDIYGVTAGFPRTEMYSLVDQLKRASFSISTNIVDGQRRNTTKEYIFLVYFLWFARRIEIFTHSFPRSLICKT